VKPDVHAVSNNNKELAEGPQFGRFFTFYFTDFPSQLSKFYLRKGFEVSGMLEEVVVPSRRNVDEELYRFVRYSNVRDVSKLLKAVNSVCFGNFRVKAKVARFDRMAVKEVEKGIEGVVGVKEREARVKDGGVGMKVVGEGEKNKHCECGEWWEEGSGWGRKNSECGGGEGWWNGSG